MLDESKLDGKWLPLIHFIPVLSIYIWSCICWKKLVDSYLCNYKTIKPQGHKTMRPLGHKATRLLFAISLSTIHWMLASANVCGWEISIADLVWWQKVILVGGAAVCLSQSQYPQDLFSEWPCVQGIEAAYPCVWGVEAAWLMEEMMLFKVDNILPRPFPFWHFANLGISQLDK